MISDNYNSEQKQVYFKAYKKLSQLEIALKHLKEENTAGLQVSILGKVNQFYSDQNVDISENTTIIKKYWKGLLGETMDVGKFYIPDSGFVFVAGSLASTFLHKINGKSLASLSSGPYGIFRGIGFSKAQANNFLKLLKIGNYVLIVRGFEKNLKNLNIKF